MTVERPSGRPIPLLKAGSPEWMARMSASKIAAVVGLSPYQSRYSLWMRMAGLVAPEEQSDEMARGHYLEPGCAAWFADQHPEFRVETTGTWVHRDHDWMVASPDRLGVREDGHTVLVQCKTAGDRENWGAAGSDEVPVGYRKQVMWEMLVTGVSTCYFATLLPYLEFREYVVRFDEAEAAELAAAARQFLDSLAAGVRPRIDEHKATYEAVKQLHPQIRDEQVEVPEAIAELYLDAIEMEKAAKDQKRFASALLADHMGTAREAWAGGRKIAQRQVKADGIPFVCVARGAVKKERAA